LPFKGWRTWLPPLLLYCHHTVTPFHAVTAYHAALQVLPRSVVLAVATHFLPSAAVRLTCRYTTAARLRLVHHTAGCPTSFGSPLRFARFASFLVHWHWRATPCTYCSPVNVYPPLLHTYAAACFRSLSRCCRTAHRLFALRTYYYRLPPPLIHARRQTPHSVLWTRLPSSPLLLLFYRVDRSRTRMPPFRCLTVAGSCTGVVLRACCVRHCTSPPRVSFRCCRAHT